jgi:hypothetical protein
MSLRLVNEDGEVLQEIYEGDSFSVFRKESADYLNDTIEWGKGWPFVKLFRESLSMLALKLSGGAFAVALVLANYIQYGSGVIAIGDKAVNNADIQKLMGYSDKTVTSIMKELVDKMVFYRGRTGKSYHYFANPYIFCRGSKINKTLQGMFKSYTVKITTETAVQP